MKKIVSLVLCLALVLALGTVAFADSTSSTVKVKVLDLNNKEIVELKDATKVVTSKTTTTSGSDTTTTYTADKYTIGDEDYFAVAEDAATLKLVDKDGKLVATVIKADATGTDLKTSKVITKTGTGTGKTGDYDEDVDYVIIDGKAYAVEEGKDWAVNSKNQFVNYNAGRELTKIAAKTTKAEKLEKGYVTYNADGKVVSFKDDDGKSYNVVDKVPASYTGEVGTITIDGKVYTYLLGSAAAASSSSSETKVDSAKTFDAGVAMYAGLALMSVAGSAVVIGKKKEF